MQTQVHPCPSVSLGGPQGSRSSIRGQVDKSVLVGHVCRGGDGSAASWLEGSGERPSWASPTAAQSSSSFSELAPWQPGVEGMSVSAPRCSNPGEASWSNQARAAAGPTWRAVRWECQLSRRHRGS